MAKKLCGAEFEPHEGHLEYPEPLDITIRGFNPKTKKEYSRKTTMGGVYANANFKCEICGHKAKEHKLVCHQHTPDFRAQLKVGHTSGCYKLVSKPPLIARILRQKPQWELLPLIKPSRKV